MTTLCGLMTLHGLTRASSEHYAMQVGGKSRGRRASSPPSTSRVRGGVDTARYTCVLHRSTRPPAPRPSPGQKSSLR